MQVTENQSEISKATAAEFVLEAAEDKDNDRIQKDALFLFAFLVTVAKAKVIFAWQRTVTRCSSSNLDNEPSGNRAIY